MTSESSPPADTPTQPSAERRKPKRLSPLTKRILAVNLVPLSFLLAGVYYLDQYEDGLVQGHLDGMRVEAQIIASALGANAHMDPITGRFTVDTSRTRVLVHRAVQTSGHRARVYSAEAGLLVADSMSIFSSGNIAVQALPPPSADNSAQGWMRWIWHKMFADETGQTPLVINQAEPWEQEAIAKAFLGHSIKRVRTGAGGIPELYILEPIQRIKRVVGVLVLSADGTAIRQDLAEQRVRFALVVLSVLVMTIALSLYLAGTIGRPVVQLAAAARRVRTGYNRREQIPDFSSRDDEIGSLSVALKDMTQSLYDRLDAIESFAADVAHEVKTPLTSLRSAVETMNLARSEEARDRLLAIIKDDVDRLDRLITDISEASRVDAELSRAESAPVDLRDLTETMVAIVTQRGREDDSLPAVALHLPSDETPLWVFGVASRLGQVVRNLLDNAISLTPADKTIDVFVYVSGADHLTLSVRDEGPGLPPGDVSKLFERFYSDRPAEDATYESHSGLGLSIVKQIVEVHKGTVTAQNRMDDTGTVMGARFDVTLPALQNGKRPKRGKPDTPDPLNEAH